MDEWIKVEDRLPTRKWKSMVWDYFNVVREDKSVSPAIFYFVGKNWRDVSHARFAENSVTHWMPLPEPPE